jgi:hypothetical protein
VDALIEEAVPACARREVELAILWGEGEGWFLSLHCFAKYVKVAFLRGASLDPVPPVASKHEASATSTSTRTRRGTRRSSRPG